MGSSKSAISRLPACWKQPLEERNTCVCMFLFHLMKRGGIEFKRYAGVCDKGCGDVYIRRADGLNERASCCQ